MWFHDFSHVSDKLRNRRSNLTMLYNKRFRDIRHRFIQSSGAFKMRPCLSSFASHEGMRKRATGGCYFWHRDNFFMSNRLKSFRGPSTPTSSPVQKRQTSRPPQSPSSPSRQTESTFHRKTRTLLQDLRTVAQTWDDLVLVDGLKAARELTDTRTDLEYVPYIVESLRNV